MAISPIQSTHSGSVACIEGTLKAEGLTLSEDTRKLLLLVEQGQLPVEALDEAIEMVKAGRSPLDAASLY